MNPLYTAMATATGGRDGRVVSSDGVLDLVLSIPKALGGPGAVATNPEQLFAAGYSACFESAIRHMARMGKITVSNLSVTCEVSIGKAPTGLGFALSAKMKVQMAGHDTEQAKALVDQAHQICPYSNATRGNLEVGISVET